MNDLKLLAAILNEPFTDTGTLPFYVSRDGADPVIRRHLYNPDLLEYLETPAPVEPTGKGTG